MKRQQETYNILYPSWKVLILPGVWALIIIVYALFNPIQSDSLVLDITEEVDDGDTLEARQVPLIFKTVYYTLRSILIAGCILYVLSCALAYLLHRQRTAHQTIHHTTHHATRHGRK